MEIIHFNYEKNFNVHLHEQSGMCIQEKIS